MGKSNALARALKRHAGFLGIAVGMLVSACVNGPLDPPAHLSSTDWNTPTNDYDFAFNLRYAGQPVWLRQRVVADHGTELFLFNSMIDSVQFAFDTGVSGVGVQSRRLGCSRPTTGATLSPFCIYDSLLFRTGEGVSARLVDGNYLTEATVAGFEPEQLTEAQHLLPTLSTGRLMGARHIESLLRHVNFVVGHFSRVKVILDIRDQWARPISESEYVELLRRRRQFENENRREPLQAEVARAIRLENAWHGQRWFAIEERMSEAPCQIDSLEPIVNETAPPELNWGHTNTARPAWDYSVYSYQTRQEGRTTYMWFNSPVLASLGNVMRGADPVLYTARSMAETSETAALRSLPLSEQIRTSRLSANDFLRFRYFGGLDRKVARGVLTCDVTSMPTNLTGQYNF